MGYLIPVTPQAFVNRHIYHNLLSISNQFCTNYIHISRLQLTFLHHIKSRSTSNLKNNSVIIYDLVWLIRINFDLVCHNWSRLIQSNLNQVWFIKFDSMINLEQIWFESIIWSRIKFDSRLIIRSNYLFVINLSELIITPI